jgi:hypothetical protein
MYPKQESFGNFSLNYPDLHSIASSLCALRKWLKIMWWKYVCFSDCHPQGLWQSSCPEQSLLWEVWVCSFSWSCTAPPHLLLPLLTCQVHQDALAAELHWPGACGQGGDAGERVPVHGEDRARRWTFPTCWLTGFLHPRNFNLKSDPMISFQKQSLDSKGDGCTVWECEVSA